MAYRYQVKAVKLKMGKWRLAVFAPTRHGHTLSSYIEGGFWDTKKEADEARTTRVRWWEFTTTDGRRSGRQYFLITEKELRQIQRRDARRKAMAAKVEACTTT